MPSVQYLGTRLHPTGWKYLWAKRVVGFDPRHHCARCLQGEYLLPFGLAMLCGENTVPLPNAQRGDVLYFCGVAAPSNWHHNLHVACIVDPDAPDFVEQAYNGHFLRFRGLRRLPFDESAARTLYPGKTEAFLTCRNFQFGASHFGI